MSACFFCFFFFFNDTATTEIYTLSLHDALPILFIAGRSQMGLTTKPTRRRTRSRTDRKSTRLNSSHGYISYAVFCLKKKKNKRADLIQPDTSVPTERHQLAKNHTC